MHTRIGDGVRAEEFNRPMDTGDGVRAEEFNRPMDTGDGVRAEELRLGRQQRALQLVTPLL